MTEHIIRNPEVYFGFCQTSMIGHFAKTVTGLCQSLFFKIVASLRPPTKLKKENPTQAGNYFRKKFYDRCLLVFNKSLCVICNVCFVICVRIRIVNPLMPGGNKRSYVLKQAYS